MKTISAVIASTFFSASISHQCWFWTSYTALGLRCCYSRSGVYRSSRLACCQHVQVKHDSVYFRSVDLAPLGTAGHLAVWVVRHGIRPASLAVRRSALPAVSAASRLRRQPLTVRDAVVERSCCKIAITLIDPGCSWKRWTPPAHNQLVSGRQNPQLRPTANQALAEVPATGVLGRLVASDL